MNQRLTEENIEYLARTFYTSDHEPKQRNSRERCSRWFDDYGSVQQFKPKKQYKGNK